MNDILQILALMRNTASMSKSISPTFDVFYERIKEILEVSRTRVYRTANIVMLEAYWNIGREIIEEEQNGKDRAKYGEFLIKNLSVKLTQAFGKGYTKSNLHYMRQFYQAFENVHALRGELTWTHYRMLLKAERKGSSGSRTRSWSMIEQLIFQ